MLPHLPPPPFAPTTITLPPATVWVLACAAIACWAVPGAGGGREEAVEKAGHPRGFPRARNNPPKTFPWAALALRKSGDVEPNPGPPRPPPGSGPCARRGAPHPQFIHELVTGRLDLLDPASRGPDGLATEWGDRDNGWPVLQCTRCLRALPTADGGTTVKSHLGTCRYCPMTEEVRRTRVALGPDTLPPMPPRPAGPTTTSAGPSPNTGRGSLATCGEVEPNPGPVHTEAGGHLRQVMLLDLALTAPGIRGHYTLQPDAPGQPFWWCVRCGRSWRAPLPAATCPDDCAPTLGPPLRGHPGWLRHRQLVIGKRSPEYQALRRAGRIGSGTSCPRIDDPCAGRRWNSQYYAWRRLLHRLAMVLVIHAPCPTGPAAPSTRDHGRSVSCPARLGTHSSGRGASLLSCRDVEANPAPPAPDWGRRTTRFCPIW